MQIITLLAFTFGLAFAQAKTLLDCRVVKVIEKNNPWEEGLSTHEYPNVSVEQNRKGMLSVHVGMALPWSEENGDEVTIEDSADYSDAVSFQKKSDPDRYVITVRESKKRRRGELRAIVPGRRAKLIAVLNCK